ncbi:hypothetical protein F2Q70_00043274 [Brassica cretica]|nr:hypothetical protein F2Q70_00043274 [Brassica cretica]
MGAEKYLGLIADQKFTGRTEMRQMDRKARGGSLHGFRTWCQPSNKLSVSRSSRCRHAWKLYMQPDILTSGRCGGVLHVSWTCSQPCGARESFRDQFSTDFELAPRKGSFQLKTSSDGKSLQTWAEREREKESGRSRVWSILKTDTPPRRPSYSPTIKWRYRLELVQIHGFRSVEVLLDTPPGSPKNCLEAKGGSVRIQISLSRPVSVFMMKPRLCPSPLRSTSCFSPRTLCVGLCEFHLEFRVVL